MRPLLRHTAADGATSSGELILTILGGQQETSSDRTPSSRMLPSVIGSIGWSKRWLAIKGSQMPRKKGPQR
jgi:hypothetical protein